MAYYYDQSYLAHFGVKGMKWGVHRSEAASLGVSRKTNREAKRDAKEYTQAKMFYGNGAGNRRKLIKATVNSKSKDQAYKKAFDHHVENTDMAKRAQQARGQRHRKTTAEKTAKTGRGIINVARGNARAASATVAGAAFVYTELYRAGKVPAPADLAADVIRNGSTYASRIPGMAQDAVNVFRK